MHMVITNAALGDPYPIDVLFMYMANMSWNSSMNIPACWLPDREDERRQLQDPEDHLLGRVLFRDGRLRRPDPARHDLPRALRLHLAARPADLGCRQRGRCDPPSGREARSRRARLPGRADRSRRPPEAARHDEGRRQPEAIPAAMPTTSSITSARRASARSRAGAARTAAASAWASPIRSSSSATSPTARSSRITWSPSSATSSTPTRTISSGRRPWASSAATEPIVFQLYLEPLQKFRLAARGHGPVQPPDIIASGSSATSIRCRSGIRRSKAT